MPRADDWLSTPLGGRLPHHRQQPRSRRRWLRVIVLPPASGSYLYDHLPASHPAFQFYQAAELPKVQNTNAALRHRARASGV